MRRCIGAYECRCVCMCVCVVCMKEKESTGARARVRERTSLCVNSRRYLVSNIALVRHISSELLLLKVGASTVLVLGGGLRRGVENVDASSRTCSSQRPISMRRCSSELTVGKCRMGMVLNTRSAGLCGRSRGGSDRNRAREREREREREGERGRERER